MRCCANAASNSVIISTVAPDHLNLAPTSIWLALPNGKSVVAVVTAQSNTPDPLIVLAKLNETATLIAFNTFDTQFLGLLTQFGGMQ